MANGPVNKGIVNSWSLISFAKSHGIMEVGDDFVSSVTGKKFSSCIFTNPNDGSRVFVAFSSKLGVLTPQEIAERKDSLQVVQLESGNYSLCKKSSSSWQVVDLGI